MVVARCAFLACWIPPLPAPSPPLLRGERDGGEGGFTPVMPVLVNLAHTPDADLELFFRHP